MALNRFWNGLRMRSGSSMLESTRQTSRIQQYMRNKRMYDGMIIRKNQSQVFEWKPLRYNLARPIIHVAADFLAARPILFKVDQDDVLTGKCDEIWTESGGSATFIENAQLGGILGDSCILITKDADDEVAYFRWLDASICKPEFDPHDYTILKGLTITYKLVSADGQDLQYVEVWSNGEVRTYQDDKPVGEVETYDEEAYGGVPAVLIRNQAIKGECFGRSDIQAVAELIEQYDHLCEKVVKADDYYSSPNLIVMGVTKNQFESLQHGERTVYFVPEGGDIRFIEWTGTPPQTDLHIDRIRDMISEISETPRITFGRTETGGGQISGVALRLLYGPALSKMERKRQTWGPSLERAMQMALIAEGHLDVDLEAISIEWPDPLPQDIMEQWQIAAEKEQMGVSKDQILKEQGYTEEEISQFKKEKQEEQDAAMKQAMKSFNAGAVPGNPYQQKSLNGAPAPKALP